MDEKEKKTHLTHCYQGEYKTSCKYGDKDCPAKPEEKGIDLLMVEDIEKEMNELKEELKSSHEMISKVLKSKKAFMIGSEEKFDNYNKIMHLVNSFFGVEYQVETFEEYKKKINDLLDKQQQSFCFNDCIRCILFAGVDLENALKTWEKQTNVDIKKVRERLKEYGFE